MTTRASAYIYQNRLCIVGVSEDRLGPIPFAVAAQIQGEVKDGPLNLAEKQEGNIIEALENARSKVEMVIKNTRLELASENLVLRARQGDQNAMAMLMGVKRNARRGVPKAVAALECIKRFISNNPPETRTSFGLENSIVNAEHQLERNAAIVAMGPSLNPHRVICMLAESNFEIEEICSAVDAGYEASFQLGLQLSRQPGKFKQVARQLPSREDYDAAKIGFLAGRAKILCMVRSGRAPVSYYSRMAGWELGE